MCTQCDIYFFIAIRYEYIVFDIINKTFEYD